jgi:hypothetical protein
MREKIAYTPCWCFATGYHAALRNSDPLNVMGRHMGTISRLKFDGYMGFWVLDSFMQGATAQKNLSILPSRNPPLLPYCEAKLDTKLTLSALLRRRGLPESSYRSGAGRAASTRAFHFRPSAINGCVEPDDAT